MVEGKDLKGRRGKVRRKGRRRERHVCRNVLSRLRVFI